MTRVFGSYLLKYDTRVWKLSAKVTGVFGSYLLKYDARVGKIIRASRNYNFKALQRGNFIFREVKFSTNCWNINIVVEEVSEVFNKLLEYQHSGRGG